MKIYQCQQCAHPVYLQNVVCENCNSWLGYEVEGDEMLALAPGGTTWLISGKGNRPYKYCTNHQYHVCNWLVPADDEDGLCQACSLNNTIPNLNHPDHLREWRALERAKHQLVYALYRLNLPVFNKDEAPERGLAFDFLSDDESDEPIMTGHDTGMVTINTNEANPVHREATRLAMKERYRTLIGHFRHEVGHYYWDRLVFTSADYLQGFRQLFGDERIDYSKALKHHYQHDAPADWNQQFITKYAAAHPWEDWAETWAHYLHLLDMLETAHSFGMRLAPPVVLDATMNMNATFDPYQETDMGKIIATCLPLTLAVNSLNRGMGRKDLYPFIVSNRVKEKLYFVHEVVKNTNRH